MVGPLIVIRCGRLGDFITCRRVLYNLHTAWQVDSFVFVDITRLNTNPPFPTNPFCSSDSCAMFLSAPGSSYPYELNVTNFAMSLLRWKEDPDNLTYPLRLQVPKLRSAYFETLKQEGSAHLAQWAYDKDSNEALEADQSVLKGGARYLIELLDARCSALWC